MTLEQAAERWPDWHLWISANGTLVCATRRHLLNPAQTRAGLDPTLIEDSMTSLVVKLIEQSDIAAGL